MKLLMLRIEKRLVTYIFLKQNETYTYITNVLRGCTAHGYDAKGNTLFLGMKNTFMKSQEPMLGEGRTNNYISVIFNFRPKEQKF